MATATEAPRRLLIVDDDEATRFALCAVLQGRGHHVTAVADGEQALHHLRHVARPDLIFLDLMMPGMNGWEFRCVQQQDPDLASVPVVILSALGESVQEADVLGDVGFLQKPVLADQLTVAIGRFARPRRPEVLVVEDDPDILRLLDRCLRQHGFAPRLAASGGEAVALFRQHADTFALGLLDVEMPGLDGPQTLAALREIRPEFPAVFMSGFTGRYAIADLLALGATDFIAKPFGLADLATRLWEQLDIRWSR